MTRFARPDRASWGDPMSPHLPTFPHVVLRLASEDHTLDGLRRTTRVPHGYRRALVECAKRSGHRREGDRYVVDVPLAAYPY